MTINLHLLRIFYTVIKHNSFSEAALALCISQPAVSKAVKELEYQLSLPLIERNTKSRQTKRIRLTENGQIIFEHARGIFALENAAIDDIRQRTELKRGRLIIGASTTVAGYWLPPYLGHFYEKYPAIQLNIRVGNTLSMCQALIDCDIDLALVEGPVMVDRLEVIPWQHDQLFTIVPQNSPLLHDKNITLATLNQHTWLHREIGSGTHDVTENMLSTSHIQPLHTIEFASNEGIARSVVAGLGIAILPFKVVAELIQIGKVTILTTALIPPRNRQLSLLRLKNRSASPLVQAFCDTLFENIG